MSRSYEQDGISRTCAICLREIVEHEHMLDLFREVSSRPEPVNRLEWVHVACSQELAQKFLLKKRARLEGESSGT